MVLTRFSYLMLFKCIDDWTVLRSIQFSDREIKVCSLPNFHILMCYFFFGLYFFSQLKNHKTLYEAYVPMEYKSYIKKMKKLDISGDQFYFDFIREHSINDNTNSVFACCLATDQESGEIMLLYKQLQTV